MELFLENHSLYEEYFVTKLLYIQSFQLAILQKKIVQGGLTKFTKHFNAIFKDLYIHQKDIQYCDGTEFLSTFRIYTILKSGTTNKVWRLL